MYLGQEFHVLGDWFIIHFGLKNKFCMALLDSELGGEIENNFSVFRILVSNSNWVLCFQITKRRCPKKKV